MAGPFMLRRAGRGDMAGPFMLWRAGRGDMAGPFILWRGLILRPDGRSFSRPAERAEQRPTVGTGQPAPAARATASLFSSRRPGCSELR